MAVIIIKQHTIVNASDNITHVFPGTVSPLKNVMAFPVGSSAQRNLHKISVKYCIRLGSFEIFCHGSSADNTVIIKMPHDPIILLPQTKCSVSGTRHLYIIQRICVTFQWFMIMKEGIDINSDGHNTGKHHHRKQYGNDHPDRVFFIFVGFGPLPRNHIFSIPAHRNISSYILSGAVNPSKSMQASRTSLVNFNRAIQPSFLSASSSVRIFVS